MTPKQIRSIKLVREVDTSPDLSFIGKYSQTPGKNAIDREVRDHLPRGEFRYFNVANPDSVEQDYQRMTAYNRGEWHMLGISAKAEIVVDGVCQQITSGGLWGIESDASEDYFREIEQDELAGLRRILVDLGFALAQIDEGEENLKKISK